MDVIQRTVLLFSTLLQRVRAIGDLLRSSYLPVINDAEESRGLFWIFNW